MLVSNVPLVLEAWAPSLMFQAYQHVSPVVLDTGMMDISLSVNRVTRTTVLLVLFLIILHPALTKRCRHVSIAHLLLAVIGYKHPVQVLPIKVVRSASILIINPVDNALAVLFVHRVSISRLHVVTLQTLSVLPVLLVVQRVPISRLRVLILQTPSVPPVLFVHRVSPISRLHVVQIRTPSVPPVLFVHRVLYIARLHVVQIRTPSVPPVLLVVHRITISRVNVLPLQTLSVLMSISRVTHHPVLDQGVSKNVL